MLGDPREGAPRRQPPAMAPIKACQVDRPPIGAERPLAPQVGVAVEVAHHELSHAAVDGLAESQAREVRLRDSAPVAAHPINADDVIQYPARLPDPGATAR